MEKLNPITDILKRVVASGFIKNIRPMSALVVAPVGGGKTTTLQRFNINEQLLGLSDCTPYGLTKLLPEIRAKNIKHIIIYDLVEPMSRNKSTVNALIGFLNSLIEEGIFRISTGFMEIKEPLQLGLISCTTPSELRDKRRGWLGMGFISRMLPISYNYTSSDVIQILEIIAKQGIEDISYEKLKPKEKTIKSNPAISQQLIPYAQAIDKGLEKPLPFRRLKQLMSLLMSNALLRNDTRVTVQDMDWFKSISKWVNYDYNAL